MKGEMLTLPAFHLLERQPRIPHVSRTVAQRDIPNEHGTAITFIVKQSRNGKDWWIHATLDSHRMSNTLHTGVASKAETWIRAVKAGQVCVARETSPAPIPPCAASMGCLCAGHARGNAVSEVCDTSEEVDDDEDDEDCCARCGSLDVDYAVWRRTGEVFGTFNQPDTVFCNDCEGGEDGNNRLISKGADPEAFKRARAKWARAERKAAKEVQAAR